MNILLYIRKSRATRIIAACIIVNLLVSTFYVPESYALTSGPAQPETNAFQQVDASQLVDPFTGDFSYNIPLMEIGGYPINLSYDANLSMDQEASWAGLGWNVNIGAISREVRGLPDDFNGDSVRREFNIKKNITYGFGLGVGVEGVGMEKIGLPGVSMGLSLGHELSYNNYTGINLKTTTGISFAPAAKPGTNVSLGLSASQEGLDISPSISYSSQMNMAKGAVHGTSKGLGLNLNSRSGAMTFSLFTRQSNSFEADKMRYRSSRRGYNYSISTATPTYTPSIEFPFNSWALSFRAKLGGAMKVVDIDGDIKGFGSEQYLAYKQSANPAFGYLNSEYGQGNQEALHDFNRDKDGAFTKNVRYLPTTSFTYDVFQVKAQGIGGSFRAYRNDFGYIREKTVNNGSFSVALAAEASFGNVIDLGFDINVNAMTSSSGLWENQNMAAGKTRFSKKQRNSDYNAATFRMSGDMSETGMTHMYNQLFRSDPVSFVTAHVGATDKIENDKGKSLTLNSPVRIPDRGISAQNIEYLTVAEVKNLFPSLAKYIPYYAASHHIGAIIVTAEGGVRYVFGLPAYNKTHQETSFAVGDPSSFVPPDANNHVGYSGNDRSINNQKGIDHFYDCNNLPPYVYTWHLTMVLSPDYVDVTGNGPSSDDFGNYTHFVYGNYNPATQRNEPNLLYGWRTPYSSSAGKAELIKGLESQPSDDKGSIIYGQKEIWYVRTIESKTHVAYFELTNRNDGIGVTGIDGAKDLLRRQKKISKIHLYAREDFEKNGIASAVPIKTVHFEYDYSLCTNVPNHAVPGDGKLTLKKVYFTYEKSGRAKYSDYEFHYGTGIHNPSYHPQHRDRWGYYKPEDPGVPNQDYPYTEQDKTRQDDNSRAWALISIELPSGGEIMVNYESDDYAYVQDKNAARMYQILGASNQVTRNYTNELFHATPSHEAFQYLYFALDEELAGPSQVNGYDQSAANQYIKNHYLHLDQGKNEENPEKYLYFRFYTNVNNKPNQHLYEYVSGYTELEEGAANCGALLNATTGTYDIGWVKIRKVPVGDSGSDVANPISKAAWQFSRIYTPKFAYNQPDYTDSGIEALAQTLANANILQQLVEMMAGVNQRMRSERFGRVFRPEKSWIRLYDPNGKKLGGGSRVKSITVKDHWGEMMPDESSSAQEYTQEFDYTIEENRRTISSGVAQWEPVFGGDENIHRYPTFYDVFKLLVPDDRFYQEYPMGEAFYPSPMVGYRRIQVKNKAQLNVTTNATGHTVYEFYTARDFPTISKTTEIKPMQVRSNPILALFGIDDLDYMTVNQGFSVELNDMHGRPKSQAIYQENGTSPISSTQYHYLTEDMSMPAPGGGMMQVPVLSNSVPVINTAGVVKTKELGIEIDVVADFRENSSFAANVNYQPNLGTAYTGMLWAIPSFFPSISVEETRFRSATITKVVRRTGILKSVVIQDLGARVETVNEAWDAITGRVLLTRVNNEFEDDRYSLSIPAHWAYDGMGHASKNWGIEFDTRISGSNVNWNRSNGTLTHAAADYATPGDEIIMPYPSTASIFSGQKFPKAYSDHSQRGWVLRAADGSLKIVDKDGRPITTTNSTANFVFKIIRSGRRNMFSAPVETVEFLENPVVSSQLQIDVNKKILNIKAIEYSEIWKTEPDRMQSVDRSQEECRPPEETMALISVLNKTFQYPASTKIGFLQLMPEERDIIFGSSCNPTIMISPATGVSALPPSITKNPYFDISFSGGGCITGPCTYRLISYLDTNHIKPADLSLVEHFEFIEPPLVNTVYGVPYPSPQINTLITAGDLSLIGFLSDGRTFHFVLHQTSTSGCVDIVNDCEHILDLYPCQVTEGDTINPYLAGIFGNWRAKKEYLYDTARTNNNINAVANIRDDGYYLQFAGNLWKKPVGTESFWSIVSSLIAPGRWEWQNEVMNFSAYGHEVENKDILGNYSAAVYGYKNTLPVAVAQNAHYKEVGFDGFEDYYLPQTSPCVQGHFKFDNAGVSEISTDDAHTGRFSLKITPTTSQTTTRATSAPYGYRSTYAAPFILTSDDLLSKFSPDLTAQKYVINLWVKLDGYNPFVHDLTSYINIDVRQGTTSIIDYSTIKKSEVIEGWQQIQYEFTTVNSVASQTWALQLSAAGASNIFVDDIRVHPYNSLMKSFVYHSDKLELMAELDENNFATFYEYDEDGALVRIKKETERGIMTIQESRNKLAR